MNKAWEHSGRITRQHLLPCRGKTNWDPLTQKPTTTAGQPRLANRRWNQRFQPNFFLHANSLQFVCHVFATRYQCMVDTALSLPDASVRSPKRYILRTIFVYVWDQSIQQIFCLVLNFYSMMAAWSEECPSLLYMIFRSVLENTDPMYVLGTPYLCVLLCINVSTPRKCR